MLEHVPDPNSIINTCSKLLKPGGKIFFSTINKNLKAFLFAIIGAEYILNLLPKGTHEYKKFIKPSQLQAWASEIILSFDSIIGMTYNPITQKYKLSQDTSVNYIVEASSEMIKKVLFDLDGTFIDSAHDLVQSANDLYLHNNILLLHLKRDVKLHLME